MVNTMTKTPYGRSDGGLLEQLVTALFSGLTTLSRYDAILGIVPFAYVVGFTVAVLTPLSIVQAVAPASLVSVVVIVDACYLNPPTSSDQETRER